jgi:hypothetical protein
VIDSNTIRTSSGINILPGAILSVPCMSVEPNDLLFRSERTGRSLRSNLLSQGPRQLESGVAGVPFRAQIRGIRVNRPRYGDQSGYGDPTDFAFGAGNTVALRQRASGHYRLETASKAHAGLISARNIYVRKILKNMVGNFHHMRDPTRDWIRCPATRRSTRSAR